MGFTKPLAQAAVKGTKEVIESTLKKLPFDQADIIVKHLNFPSGSPHEIFVRDGGIHPIDGPGLVNAIKKGEAQDLGQYIDHVVKGEQGAYNEIGRIADNSRNDFIQDTGKAQNAQAAMEGASPKPAEPTNINPTRYEIDSAGKPGAEADLQRWFDQELKKAGGDSSKIDRSQFAPEGVFIDGQRQGIKGLSKGKPKFYNLGPMEERAFFSS